MKKGHRAPPFHPYAIEVQTKEEHNFLVLLASEPLHSSILQDSYFDKEVLADFREIIGIELQSSKEEAL